MGIGASAYYQQEDQQQRLKVEERGLETYQLSHFIYISHDIKRLGSPYWKISTLIIGLY